jgi:hypothetical protein
MDTVASHHAPAGGKAPLHLWAMAASGLLWALFSAYGYAVTALRDPAQLAKYPAEILQYLDALPVWARAARSCGIVSLVVGAIALLLRSRHAFWLFVVTLASLCLGTLGEQFVVVPASLRSAGMLALRGVNWTLLVALVAYTHWGRRRGLLR